MRRFALIAVVLGAVLTTPSVADAPTARQYYSKWTKHSTRPYYYRYYYYKKSATDKEYTYHYGIYYPSRGKRVYMFNPHKQQYWGYWDGESYSVLPAEKRKASIDDIDADDFPKPGKAPKIPEADDDTVMEAPPKDFPKPDDKP